MTSRLLPVRLLPAVGLLLLTASCTTTPAPEGQPPSASEATAAATRFDAVLAGDWRTPAFRKRDTYRHPAQTLDFFGVQADDVVVEITPGAGWYSEILAPYLATRGRYVAALAAATAGSAGARRNDALRAKFAADPARYGTATVHEFDPKSPAFGAPASADVVLTFRNVHNWVAAGSAADHFTGFFQVLRPGGVLGVVDHRAPAGTDPDSMKRSGYLTEALVIELATAAGFRLDARSPVNANPRDHADHPNGVWTLPPTNRHEPVDAERYRAIGESDRMTLRFVKPG
ncbi:MAG: methyltransferase [Pseudoxanthomonas suwonensis]|nr:methyltransferase [Pseudoxanthomonas suwonensis]